MKSIVKIALLGLLLFVGIRMCNAQDTTLLLKPSMYDKDTLYINIGKMKGWLFKEGNDTSLAKKDIDLTGWKRLMPIELSKNMADKNGRVEGWFRIKIKLDSSFGETPFGLNNRTWAAVDCYINGNRVATFGNTGINGTQYIENKFTSSLLPVPVNLKPGNDYTIALHVVDYLSPFPPYDLKTKFLPTSLDDLIIITGPKYNEQQVKDAIDGVYFMLIFAIICGVLSLLFWLLFFQNRNEKNLLLFALASTFLTIFLISTTLINYIGAAFLDLSYNWYWINFNFGPLGLTFFFITFPFILAQVFNRRVFKILKTIFILFLLIEANSIVLIYDFDEKFSIIVSLIFVLSILISCIYYLFSSWKTLQGPQWAIVIGLMLMLFFCLLLITIQIILLEKPSQISSLILSLMYLSFPISMMVYVSMRFKEIIKEVRENAMQVVQMSEEKKEQAINQQKILQEEVNRQTAEIRTTLDNLKSTQHQLIQSEKMASLGELTAGIAHEIQNPLNFVNNFSEVSTELVDEMNEEIKKGNLEDATAIAADLKQNLEKINHHGKRAGDIVKGMLQHSRSSSGQKEPTDINGLADEYLRLAYHGLRAKDKSFNATMKTEFDESIGKINIISQDIGRVILNLITNAFYVVNEKKKSGIENFEPTVSVSTKKVNGSIEIKVADNGNGIPPKILDKIFQPFFTTKPTGQGTGLGLSLSYDIVKAHGGELKVETKEGEGSEFVISLPV